MGEWNGVTQEEMAALVGAAVKNAKPQGYVSTPRWAAVRDLFCVGSTQAKGLCRRYGVDPDEAVIHDGVKVLQDELDEIALAEGGE